MSKEVITALLNALSDEDKSMRSTAARALGHLGPDMGNEVIAAFLSALSDKEELVRGTAADTLTQVTNTGFL